MITILKNILHRIDSFAVVRTRFISYNEDTDERGPPIGGETESRGNTATRGKNVSPSGPFCRKAFL